MSDFVPAVDHNDGLESDGGEPQGSRPVTMNENPSSTAPFGKVVVASFFGGQGYLTSV